jgi:hypothetical protein
VRRFWIQKALPTIFCLLPIAAAGLVAVAFPREALKFYIARVLVSPMDWLILGVGFVLFLIQLVLSRRALRWRGTSFDERPDPWLSQLVQSAEWFPLLGLIGTVAGILQTFSSIKGPTGPQEIIANYAPAITATGSGLFMALLNILPTWVVSMGRDVIRSLGNVEPATPGEMHP